MTRYLKTLGLALVAALAISAVGASAASADLFKAEAEPTHLTGVGTDNVFTITDPDLSVACSTALFEGTTKETATSITVDAKYEGTPPPETTHEGHCETSLGFAAIDMNSCDYKLTSITDAKHNEKENTHAQVHVECEKEGDHIQITDSSGCTIEVPEQTPTEGGITYENIGNHVKLNVTATGITYTTTGFVCALGGLPSEANNADYEGTVTVKGYSGAPHNEANQVKIEVEET